MKTKEIYYSQSRKKFTHDTPASGRDRGRKGAFMRGEDAEEPAGAGRERSCTNINPYNNERR